MTKLLTIALVIVSLGCANTAFAYPCPQTLLDEKLDEIKNPKAYKAWFDENCKPKPQVTPQPKADKPKPKVKVKVRRPRTKRPRAPKPKTPPPTPQPAPKPQPEPAEPQPLVPGVTLEQEQTRIASLVKNAPGLEKALLEVAELKKTVAELKKMKSKVKKLDDVVLGGKEGPPSTWTIIWVGWLTILIPGIIIVFFPYFYRRFVTNTQTTEQFRNHIIAEMNKYTESVNKLRDYLNSNLDVAKRSTGFMLGVLREKFPDRCPPPAQPSAAPPAGGPQQQAPPAQQPPPSAATPPAAPATPPAAAPPAAPAPGTPA